MRKQIVFMFTGQGSQYYQMGLELYNVNSTFNICMKRLDSIFQDLTGKSVLSELYSGKHKKSDIFNNLFFTHPAIFMVEYSLAQVLIESGIYPDIILGSSLGEYTSCAVAGVMSPEDIIGCLVIQVQALEETCREGRMIAVLENPGLFYKNPIFYNNSELAAVNYSKHFLASGEVEGCTKVINYLKNEKFTYGIIPVKYGFHSSAIQPAACINLEYLKKKVYSAPTVSFVSSLTGKKIDGFEQSFLWDVARMPIMLDKAIKSTFKEDSVYIDLGMSGTMANFAKNILCDEFEKEIYTVIERFGNEKKKLETLCKEILDNKVLSIKKERREMKAYVFPGQGSQSKGMGKDLFDKFHELTSKADEVLGYSIKKLCLEDPDRVLGFTQYTQPALYVVNALTYLNKIEETGKKPDFVAGHSLGEYDALFAAGVFNFETGLKIVKKRGELMSKAKAGGMAAVIGMSEDKIRSVLEENRIEGIDIANLNTPSQIVISGTKDDIVKAQPVFEKAGAAKYILLAVSGAFHSRYMEGSKKEFEQFLTEFELNNPSITVISNFTARPYKNSEIKRNMAEQITGAVKWVESIRYLMGKGDALIEQVGPGNALSGMLRTILAEAQPLVIEGDEIHEDVSNCVDKKSEDDSATIEVQDKAGLQALENKTANSEGINELGLGSKDFKQRYGLKYAYITGGMYRGIASGEMVVKVGKAGMMGFLGTGGMNIEHIEDDIKYIQKNLKDNQAYGVNFLSFPSEPSKEEEIADLFLRNSVKIVEASAFMNITPALVKYRLKGLKRNTAGVVNPHNRVIAKVSRPEVAQAFLSPAPQRIVEKLISQNKITKEEAELSQEIPMADDITIEADSGGHTDGGVAYALMPAMIKLRDEMVKKYGYKMKIGIGGAGGIGTPEAAAAAFILGADYIVTGSINQCTVEACTSEAVKDLLQNINVQDTEYAPAGDMFELGSKVQVLKKGVFFPARANKLYELYRQYNSLDEIDGKTRKQLEERYFTKTFDSVFTDVKSYYPSEEIEKAESNPKHKMSLVFKWYFNRATYLALNGDTSAKVDYQIHCGPALGAFNQWVKGTNLESWKNRHVDEIGIKLMHETARLLNERFNALKLA